MLYLRPSAFGVYVMQCGKTHLAQAASGFLLYKSACKTAQEASVRSCWAVALGDGRQGFG